MYRQCSSCGGFCKKSGCERENVATDDTLTKRVDETEKDRHEPVAWMYVNTDGECEQIEYGEPYDDISVTPLYTAPPQSFTYEQVKAHIQVALLSSLPQRTWVGLTDEEVEEIERWVEFKEESSGRIPMGKLVSYISEKLRNKNT